jgi:AcrR family transcriptional regulator
MSIKSNDTPRVRRSPEESRANILAAAEQLLVEQGPQSLRLADVAKAAGVANATVLHHFGSIERRSAGADGADDRAISSTASWPSRSRRTRRWRPALSGLKTLFDALETPGAARLAAWLELTDETSRLTVVREAVQEVAQKKISQAGVPEDVAEDMILLSVTLALGVGLFGPSLGKLIGKPEGRARELTLQMLLANFQRLAG